MKVRIGALDYEIVDCPNLRDPDDEEHGLDGHIDHSSCTVKIRAELAEQLKHVVVWHEVMHGILVQAGMTGEHADDVIDRLAYGVVAALRDNPWLAKSWRPR